jgi:two-component sensor histidine kinase
MNAERRRMWTWYALAWIPLALFEAVLMRSQRATYSRPAPSVPQALFEGFTYVIPVALLGVAVWWLTGKLRWPPRRLSLFLAAYVAGGLAFAAVWLVCEVGFIAIETGMRAAIAISKTFAGFQLLEGVFVYGLLAGTLYALRMAARLRQEEARAARADSLRARAELAALRGQLNPHFLFNTLHTLTALVRRDPETAEHALERFGDMLRYVLDVKRSSREDVTLGDELAFVRTYLSLEQLRFGDRLRVAEQIDADAVDCILPSLTLQPLVENAIKYGIAPRAAGGSIEITASLDADVLLLGVRDDGPGAQRDVVAAAAGLGLRAVRQRLDVRYGAQSRFDVSTSPGAGFDVRIALPAQTGSPILQSAARRRVAVVR